MNKRGSYIAEAAIVLPFIILAVITCVLIVMDFYEGVSQQCEEHRVERAGEVTEAAALEDADEELPSAPAAKIAGVSYVRKYQVAQRLTNTDDNDIDNNNDNNDNNDNLEE